MDFAEFERLAEPLRQRSAASVEAYGLALVERRTATEREIAETEHRMGLFQYASAEQEQRQQQQDGGDHQPHPDHPEGVGRPRIPMTPQVTRV
jgi:hypothetical protein